LLTQLVLQAEVEVDEGGVQLAAQLEAARRAAVDPQDE